MRTAPARMQRQCYFSYSPNSRSAIYSKSVPPQSFCRGDLKYEDITREFSASRPWNGVVPVLFLFNLIKRIISSLSTLLGQNFPSLLVNRRKVNPGGRSWGIGSVFCHATLPFMVTLCNIISRRAGSLFSKTHQYNLVLSSVSHRFW